MGNLYIIATPIGNLSDITLRGLEILKSVDLVLAEDTRVTSKLLMRYDIKKDILTYNQHTFRNKNKLNQILELLLKGKNIALVSDAGTPGISDPGNELIDFICSYSSGAGLDFPRDFVARKSRSGQSNVHQIEIIPIPGPSAVSAALSVCGFDVSRYTFIGFFPKKKKTKLIKLLTISNMPFAYFDSPHRLIKNLEYLKAELGDRRVFVGRELTKLHETLYRGKISSVLEELGKSDKRGEVVVVVEMCP
jgi:16S rRNA (cytidine1402-2'-O)-methyltransferase